MLRQVLKEFEEIDDVLTLNEMAARLDVQSSVLKGMIDFWVRKGRLRQVGLDDGDFVQYTGCCLASNMERGRGYELVKSGREAFSF